MRKNRFIVLLNGGTAEQHTAFKTFLNSTYPHAGWWHRFTTVWLVTDLTNKITASAIRDAAMGAFPGVHLLVIQMRPDGSDTWAGFGPGSGQLDMFSWIKETWDKTKDV